MAPLVQEHDRLVSGPDGGVEPLNEPRGEHAAAALLLALVRLYAPAPLAALAVLYIEVIRGTPLLIQLFLLFSRKPG